ncbi:MAG: FAD-linked oxidoreductase, partial [Rubrobacter sp.]
MDRRQFLKSAAVILALSSGVPKVLRACTKGADQAFHRVRPGDPTWPSEASWGELRQAVHGRLIKVHSPLDAC